MTVNIKETREYICDICGRQVSVKDFSFCSDIRKTNYVIYSERYTFGRDRLDTCNAKML